MKVKLRLVRLFTRQRQGTNDLVVNLENRKIEDFLAD